MATVPKTSEPLPDDPRLKVVTAGGNATLPPLDQLRAEAIQALRSYSSPRDAIGLLPLLERLLRLCREEASSLVGVPPRLDRAVDEADILPLSRVVRDYVVRVYQTMGRNKTRAARVLEIDIKTLYNKLKRYGVQ